MGYADLEKLNKTSYPLYFCGIPTGEPACSPSRPGEYPKYSVDLDRDQDGVYDSLDNCPAIFNPPRPMDKGVQPGYFCKIGF